MSDQVAQALKELVAVEDLERRAKALHFAGPLSDEGENWKDVYDSLRRDYIRRYSLAWDEARKALAAFEAAPQQAQAPIDPDGEQSRAGFRAFDEAQVAQWATPWQVWSEAVKWAAQQAQAPGWQLARVSDGDIRVYGPDKETWLIHKDCGEGFYDFIYRYFEAAIGAAPQQGSKS